MTSVASATKRRWFEHQFLGLILFPIFVWAFGVGLHGNPIRPDHHTVLSMMLGGLLGAGLFTATLIANHRQGKISVSVFQGLYLGSFLVLTSKNPDAIQATIFLTLSGGIYGAVMYWQTKPTPRPNHAETMVLPQAFSILTAGWCGALGMFWTAPDMRVGVAWATACLWLAPTSAQPITSPKRIAGAVASVALGLFLIIAV